MVEDVNWLALFWLNPSINYQQNSYCGCLSADTAWAAASLSTSAPWFALANLWFASASAQFCWSFLQVTDDSIAGCCEVARSELRALISFFCRCWMRLFGIAVSVVWVAWGLSRMKNLIHYRIEESCWCCDLDSADRYRCHTCFGYSWVNGKLLGQFWIKARCSRPRSALPGFAWSFSCHNCHISTI